MTGHDHDHSHDHAHGHGHSHGFGHGHAHDHGHGAAGHSHGPASFGMAFALGTGLNMAFVAAQVVFGIWAHSMALLADAVHNLGDVLAIAIEAFRRFGDASPVAGSIVMWVAALGILINGGTALLFMRGRKDDLNIRGAFLHMAADAAVSAGVVLSGLVIMLTGWQWLDPVTSLLIVAVIVIGTWSLLRESANLAMDAVPEGIEMTQVEAMLRGLPGVVDVHDLHVWGLSTTETALTAHLVLQYGTTEDLLRVAETEVRTRFRIGHATFQVETPALAETCALRPAHVI